MSESTEVAGTTLGTEQRDGVLIIWIDVPGEPVNTLNQSMVGEFEAVFAALEKSPELKGVVIASGKSSGFIAGADIEQFNTFKSPHDAEQVSAMGQELLNRLEALPIPVVAAIHGACLGGGLEVARACK
jgi:3-hydroxyacyl-CoA dehydrogenase/enoyl-CoA hydratase/3-hydroxybutyryl-CoA epimerase